jgi:hypothetical protein
LRRQRNGGKYYNTPHPSAAQTPSPQGEGLERILLSPSVTPPLSGEAYIKQNTGVVNPGVSFALSQLV